MTFIKTVHEEATQLPTDHDGVTQLHVYPAGHTAYRNGVEETRRDKDG